MGSGTNLGESPFESSLHNSFTAQRGTVMALNWTVSVTSHKDGFPDETAAIGNFSRPLDGATPADFGLSLNEAQGMIGVSVI